MKRPGEFFHDNMVMAINILESCRKFDVKKVVLVGSCCSYPKVIPTPFKEEDFWNGYPEETNAPYGIAKKAMMTMGSAYRSQYGMNIISLILTNLYGPNDNLDPSRSHVIPALIKRFVAAREQNLPSVEVWGTGKAFREFLHVDDAARGILLAFEKYDGADYVNLGSGREVAVKELVKMIKSLGGYKGKITWNSEFPDGQPRRCLDTTRAENLFGFKAEVGLEEGLKETVEWYEKVK